MDLDILKIASDTKNMKKLENFTHSALKKNPMCGDYIKLSFKVLFMVILGGLGSINGAFIGAAFILLFPVLLNYIGNNVFHGAIDATIISAIEQVVFGVLMIIFMIYEPLGMAKLWETIKIKIAGLFSKNK